MDELIKDGKDVQKSSRGIEQDTFQSFDHQYFEIEIKELIKEYKITQFERFGKRGNDNYDDMEYDALQQIHIRLFQINDQIEQLLPFDAKQRMEEIHAISDTLVKIRSGNFAKVRE